MSCLIDADVMILDNVIDCGLFNFENLRFQYDTKDIVLVTISYGRVMIFLIRWWTQIW